MALRFRPAVKGDIPDIAGAAVDTVRHIRRQGVDPYAQGLPDGVTEPVLEWAARFTEGGDRGGLVLTDGRAVVLGCACLAVGASAMPEALTGRVGTVALMWVTERERGKGLGGLLNHAVEKWFAEQGVRHIELSWLALNAEAETFWRQMGYQPYRTHAWKAV